MKLCSSDTRSEGQSGDSLGREGVMVQRRNRKALAWANGTSRRASGWAGEKVALNGRPSSPPSRERWKSGGCSIHAVETTPAASLNAGVGKVITYDEMFERTRRLVRILEVGVDGER